MKLCPSEFKARLQPWEKLLDRYDREEKFDTIPVLDKELSREFFRIVVPTSPNKTDVVKIRHPLWPTQFYKKTALLWYETYDKLWHRYRNKKAPYPALCTKYKQRDTPNTALQVFLDYRPPEMRKAEDFNCLCIGCEGMNCLLCGRRGAIKAMDSIMDAARKKDNSTNPDVPLDIGRLADTKEIVNEPST